MAGAEAGDARDKGWSWVALGRMGHPAALAQGGRSYHWHLPHPRLPGWLPWESDPPRSPRRDPGCASCPAGLARAQEAAPAPCQPPGRASPPAWAPQLLLTPQGTHRVGLGGSKGCSTLEAAVPAEGVQHRPTQPSRVKGPWARCGGGRAVPVGAGRGANEASLTSWRCAQAWGWLQLKRCRCPWAGAERGPGWGCGEEALHAVPWHRAGGLGAAHGGYWGAPAALAPGTGCPQP